MFDSVGRKREMKKLITLALTLALVASTLFVTGCGGSSGDSGDKKETFKIGIVQLVEHPSLDTIRENIIKGLEDEGFKEGENLEIDYQNGQNDMSTMKNIAQKFVGDEVDVIVAIATPAAQAALSETTDIPIIFAAVTDPAKAELVMDNDAPGGNVTGTSDAIAVDKIMALAEQMTPGFKTIGALYNSGEANSASVIEDLKAYAKKNGLKLETSTVTNTSEVQQAAQTLADKCDIVFSPIDNTVASSMKVATDVFNKAKVPFYVSADSMVNDGGLATCGIDYSVLGKETGKMVAQVLNGSDPATMAVKTMSDLQVYINQETADTIGVKIPQDLIDKGANIL